MKKWYENRQAELRTRGEKGFTLMEMLIVVAIIAVLIAIAIPVFTSQLENSREATDAANLRSKYAEVAAAGMLDPDYASTESVKAQQQKGGWQNSGLSGQSIGDQVLGTGSGAITGKTDSWTVTWNSGSQTVVIS